MYHDFILITYKYCSDERAIMIKSYTNEGVSIDCLITYRKKKSKEMLVDLHGNVEIKVPRDTSDQVLEEMVMARWPLILKKQTEMRQKANGYQQKDYVAGETFLYLGKSYPIVIEVDANISKEVIKLHDEELVIRLKEQSDEKVIKLLKRFYRQKCKKLVEKRLQYYQSNFKVKPRGFTITDSAKTWGTCNSNREMTFNWKLVMAPMAVVDYVVVHEMCHMVHMNHDRSFWRLVGKHIPNYEEMQTWLQQSEWKMVV